MHELSVCLALMTEVESISQQHQGAVVEQIYLKVGPLSGVEPDLLRNAYPLAAAGTVAEHAELIIDTGEIVVRCTQCGASSTVTANRLLCGSCGDYRTRVTSGDEMLLERVELSTRH